VKPNAYRRKTPRLFAFLLEHRPAGLAEAGLLPPQAGSDRPDIGNLARAETVDVGCAGPFLFGCCEFGERGAGREQSEKKSERERQTDAGLGCLTSVKF
jgi:hypothetical protein